jgi:hypothetical protein
MKNALLASALGVGLALTFGASAAYAANDCVFATNNKNKTMRLAADCTTDATILIPDKFTLDGQGFSITAKDPPLGSFIRGVISNAGGIAHVTNVIVDTANLSIVCHSDGSFATPDHRLRGILFESASGSITKNMVLNINQGASGCQEGNAIEVRNPPFDGTHPATKSVNISNNRIFDWQKGGIIANGDVKVKIEDNIVGASATQANLAANSIQIGFGGKGEIKNNLIEGNSWCCEDAAASAILLIDTSSGVEVENNNINLVGGNADVGIFILTNNAKVRKNRVYDVGPDGFYDIGIGDYGLGNVILGNKVRCFDIPFDTDVSGFSGAGNTLVDCPGESLLARLSVETDVEKAMQASPAQP